MSFVVRGNNVYKSLSGALFPGTARYVNAQTILKDHHSLNIFAETMSFDEDRVNPSGEESKAEGDSGNGANQLKVSEKEIRKGNEPQERKTPTSQITGEENDKGKKAPAPKPKKADDERKFSSNTYRKEGEGDQSADEKKKEAMSSNRILMRDCYKKLSTTSILIPSRDQFFFPLWEFSSPPQLHTVLHCLRKG